MSCQIVQLTFEKYPKDSIFAVKKDDGFIFDEDSIQVWENGKEDFESVSYEEAQKSKLFFNEKFQHTAYLTGEVVGEDQIEKHEYLKLNDSVVLVSVSGYAGLSYDSMWTGGVEYDFTEGGFEYEALKEQIDCIMKDVKPYLYEEIEKEIKKESDLECMFNIVPNRKNIDNDKEVIVHVPTVWNYICEECGNYYDGTEYDTYSEYIGVLDTSNLKDMIIKIKR